MRYYDIGPVNIYRVNPDDSLQNLGPSEGGVSMNFEMDVDNILFDEDGSAPVNQVITGMGATLTIPMTALTVSKLNIAIPSSELVYAPSGRLYVGNPVGGLQSDNAIKILLKRIVNGIETTTAFTSEYPEYPNWVTILKAAPQELGEIAYSKDSQQIFEIVFRCFPDDSTLSPLGLPSIVVFGNPPGSVGSAVGADAGYWQGVLLDLQNPSNGQIPIYNSTSGKWELGSSSGVTDHGLLTGLGDDDHIQYLLRSLLTTAGDLPYAAAASTWARLAIGTGRNLILSPNAGIPAWRTATQVLGINTFFVEDHASLAAAISACSSAGGGTVILSGNTTYNETISISGVSDINIIGQGRSSVINGGTSGHAITIHNSNDITFSNLAVQTTAGGGTAYCGFNITGTSGGISIDKVFFPQTDHYGILAAPTGEGYIISRCEFDSIDTAAIGFNQPSGVVVVGNIFYDTGSSCMYIQDTTYGQIVGNSFLSTNATLAIQFYNTTTTGRFSVSGNSIYTRNSGAVSIQLNAGCNYNAVASNTIRGTVANFGTGNSIGHNA